RSAPRRSATSRAFSLRLSDQLPEADEVEVLAVLEHGLRQVDVAAPAAFAFQALAGHEYAAADDKERLADGEARIREQDARLVAAAHREAGNQRRPGERLDAHAGLAAAQPVDAPHEPYQPIGAAFGLKRKKHADPQPVVLRLWRARAEAAAAHVLHDPALRRVLVELERRDARDRAHHGFEAVHDG